MEHKEQTLTAQTGATRQAPALSTVDCRLSAKRAARAIQPDLFAPKPVWLETVLRKLPGSDFLSVVDVALAFGVSTSKVTEWIEEGRLEATNLNAGTPKKTFWKIPRASAEALARHISQGI
ncbi:MAG: hypothetical protein ACI4RT_05430 [Candidatus Spyradenecus sp.]